MRAHMRLKALTAALSALVVLGACAPRGTAAAQETPSAGRQLYVHPDGNDGNSGLSGREPFETIGKALSMVRPGDTVNIAPGTYGEIARPAVSGTARAPITLRGDGQGEVIWTSPEREGETWDEKFALNLRDRSHFVVDGITFKDCAAWILIYDGDHNTVRNCVFDGSRIYNSMRISNGRRNRVLNCRFKRAKPYAFNKYGVSTNRTAADFIEIFHDSHYNLVQDCTFGEIGHVAVSISPHRGNWRPSHNIVRNCVFTNPRWKCLGLHAAPYTLVEDNVCSGRASVFVQFECPKVIMRRNVLHGFIDGVTRDAVEKQHNLYRGAVRIASTMDSNANSYSFHNRIYNNLFTGNERTITSYSASRPMIDNIFKNNIIYDNEMTLWLCQPDYTATTRHYFVNNVLQGTAPGQEIIGLGSDRYTLAAAQAKMSGFFKGNLEADPMFVDAAGADFRLKQGSPCIDAGAHLAFAINERPGGNGSTELIVDDPLYFCDGWGLIEPDTVVVGSNKPVRIARIDYDAHALTLAEPIKWKRGDPVGLPYKGKAPDIGPHEFDTQ